MATSLPFLNFPLLVSERVLRNFTFSELFDLSQCSKRCFDLTKTSKIRNTDIMVTIDSETEVAVANKSESVLLYTSWMFNDARDPRRRHLGNPSTYKVDGMLMNFCRSLDDRGYVKYNCASNHSTRDVIKFCEHLMDLFNAKVYVLGIKCHKMECLDQLLSIEAFRTPKYIRTDSGEVTHEELRKILDGFDTERLELCCKVNENFAYDQPIKANDFIALHGSWFTGQMLLDLDCEHASISYNCLTAEDINSFLKQWLEGSNTRLEYICLSPLGPIHTARNPTPLKWNHAKIFEGIPTVPGAAKRPEIVRYHTMGGVPYEDGLDLKRESDGMLATALFYVDLFGIETFLFEVWQVPDPNVVVEGSCI